MCSMSRNPVRLARTPRLVDQVTAQSVSVWRHGYIVTWRVLAYPLGYLLPLTAIPGLRWVAAAYMGVLLLAIGLAVVKGISFGRAFLSCLVVTGLLFAAYPALPG